MLLQQPGVRPGERMVPARRDLAMPLPSDCQFPYCVELLRQHWLEHRKRWILSL